MVTAISMQAQTTWQSEQGQLGGLNLYAYHGYRFLLQQVTRSNGTVAWHAVIVGEGVMPWRWIVEADEYDMHAWQAERTAFIACVQLYIDLLRLRTGKPACSATEQCAVHGYATTSDQAAA